jgi:hypothetical protein
MTGVIGIVRCNGRSTAVELEPDGDEAGAGDCTAGLHAAPSMTKEMA